MQPSENPLQGMTSINLAEEIEEIKTRLREMGEVFERNSDTSPDFKRTDRPHKIAAHKVKAAKRRKQKRKSGGPR